jgi:hypothetical protein
MTVARASKPPDIALLVLVRRPKKVEHVHLMLSYPGIDVMATNAGGDGGNAEIRAAGNAMDTPESDLDEDVHVRDKFVWYKTHVCAPSVIKPWRSSRAWGMALHAHLRVVTPAFPHRRR